MRSQHGGVQTMKKVNLFCYYPPYLSEYREVNEILKLENKDLTKLWKEIDRAFLNTFIFSADSLGLSIFEEMLNLYPKATDSLEDRRRRIYIKWNETLPYTERWLKNFLKIFFNRTTTTAAFKVFYNEYRLQIKLKSQEHFSDKEYRLYPVLREKIPANMVLDMINVLNNSRGSSHFKSGLVYRLKKEMLSEVLEKDIVSKLHSKGNLIYRIKKEMTNV